VYGTHGWKAAASLSPKADDVTLSLNYRISSAGRFLFVACKGSNCVCLEGVKRPKIVDFYLDRIGRSRAAGTEVDAGPCGAHRTGSTRIGRGQPIREAYPGPGGGSSPG